MGTTPGQRADLRKAIEVMTHWTASDSAGAAQHMGVMINEVESEDILTSTVTMLTAMINLCGLALTECAFQTGGTEQGVLQAIAHKLAMNEPGT